MQRGSTSQGDIRGFRFFAVAASALSLSVACGAPVDESDGTTASAASSLTAAPGTVDASFGAKCVDTTAQFSVITGPRALLQGDKILTAAMGTNPADGASVFALVRFTNTGAVDTTFGTRGYVKTSWPGNVVTAEVRGMTTGVDGKVVLVGAIETVVTDSAGVMKQPTAFGVARYSAAGVLDSTFGQGGKVTTPIFGKADRANVVLVQPDGKVLVGGQGRPVTAGYKGGDVTVLARYTSGGALDSSFGQGGIVTVVGGSPVVGLGLEANGNIVAATPSLQRFSASGAPITAPFTGTLTQTTPGQFGAVALQSDGKRIAAGAVRSPTSKHASFATISRVAVDGTVEFTTPGFNYGTGVGNVSAVLQAILVEPSGRIIGGGQAALSLGSWGFGLVAVQPSGTIDGTFGSSTGLSTRITGGNDAVSALLLQPDNKIVAVGYCPNGIGLARYVGP